MGRRKQRKYGKAEEMTIHAELSRMATVDDGIGLVSEISEGPETSIGPEAAVGPEATAGPEAAVGPEATAGPEADN